MVVPPNKSLITKPGESAKVNMDPSGDTMAMTDQDPLPPYTEKAPDAAGYDTTEKVPIPDGACVLDVEDMVNSMKIINEQAAQRSERSEEEEEEQLNRELEEAQTFAPWSEASMFSKVTRIVFYVSAPVLILGMLYFFICALDILTAAFRLVAGRVAGEVFANSTLLNNPISGLMIGVLVTVLVQSSSTSTSIVVSLVSSGVLSVKQAIPIIMGANIGTTVTSVLVSLTQSASRTNFQRSFSGATVHDMFNWCCVLILLPIEIATGYLYHVTELMTKSIGNPNATAETVDFLKVITTPLTNKIIRVDSSVINAIAEGAPTSKYPMIRSYCPLVTADWTQLFHPLGSVDEAFYSSIERRPYAINLELDFNNTDNTNATVFSWNDIDEANSTKCDHLFVGQGVADSALSELEVGLILLFGSLTALIICLIILVKVLGVLMKGPMAKAIRRVINADFPGYAAFLTGYFAIIMGAGLTILVQSSSVFMSTVTPLVGIGLIDLQRVYPLALGSNIGTTITGILAALTASADMIGETMQIAFCHLIFNITGIIIFYPIPFMRKIPIGGAKFLGRTTGRYRWFAALYVLTIFLFLPLLVFALSLAGWYVLLGVAAPFILIIIIVIIVNLLQKYRSKSLPEWLKTWDFLPEPLRSLAPYDRALTICCSSKYCRCCKTSDEPEVVENTTEAQSETSFTNSQGELIPRNQDSVPTLRAFSNSANSYVPSNAETSANGPAEEDPPAYQSETAV